VSGDPFSTHFCSYNDLSLSSEKAHSKQRKQVEHRARLGRRSTEGLETLVNKSVKRTVMYSQNNKEKHIRVVRGIGVQESMDIDSAGSFPVVPATTPGLLPRFSSTRPLPQPVAVDTQSETPRRLALGRLGTAIQEQPTRRPAPRPSLESERGSMMPPTPLTRQQRTTESSAGMLFPAILPVVSKFTPFSPVSQSDGLLSCSNGGVIYFDYALQSFEL